MEWFGNWIMETAGVIVIGAICDMIMPSGDMKKYVKLTVGLVLVFTILGPIVRADFREIEFPPTQQSKQKATELMEKLGYEEQQALLGLYTEKLQKTIEDKTHAICGAEVSAKAFVEGNSEENFGDIKSVELLVNGEVDEEKLKNDLGRELGIEPEEIQIETR